MPRRKGYEAPEHIIRKQRSPYWYVLIKKDGKTISRSTRTTDLARAKRMLHSGFGGLKPYRKKKIRSTRKGTEGRATKRSLENGYNVYFIQVKDEDGPIKIGVSRNVQSRLRDMKVSNHEFSIRLLASVKGGTDMERQIHHRFQYANLHHEWFKPDPQLLAFIQGLCNFMQIAQKDHAAENLNTVST